MSVEFASVFRVAGHRRDNVRVPPLRLPPMRPLAEFWRVNAPEVLSVEKVTSVPR